VIQLSQQPDRLLKLILILTSITMTVVWLPMIRGLMDGETYAWALTFLGTDYGGKGLGGQYWVVALEAAWAIAILYLGWRGARPPFYWLLLLWNVSGAINSFYNSIKFPDDYRFQGDTLGINFSVAWIGPLFWSVLTFLSILWFIRQRRSSVAESQLTWSGSNKLFTIVALAFLPLQFILLRFGAPLSTMDQAGVILTLLQWVILNLAFAKRSPSLQLESR
jgi:hypothetical protein